MNDNSREEVQAQPPLETGAIHVHHVKEAAAGMPAVVSSMRHAYREMGGLRGLKMLRQVNQTDGFDCPGCAWPEPDHAPGTRPSSARTARRPSPRRRRCASVGTAEFFAEHSMSTTCSGSSGHTGSASRAG